MDRLLSRLDSWSRSFPAAFAVTWALALFATDFQLVFEFDPDEGNNLIKALLLDRGYGFLSEIWSDQPPLYTYLLWGLFKIYGFSVGPARVMSVLFSALLVFAACDIARREAGVFASVATGIMLCATKGFTKLAVSVMIGLPAIAMAMLSVWAICRYREEKRWGWLFGAGVSLGISLSIKLFTAVVPPVAGIGVLILLAAPDPKNIKRIGTGLGVFAGGMVLALILGLLPALVSGNFGELFQAHLDARGVYVSYSDVAEFLSDDREIFLLSLVGFLAAIKRCAIGNVICGGWILLAAVMLQYHDPVWQHHAQLLSVPAAVAAGLGLSTALHFLPGMDSVKHGALRLSGQGAALITVLSLIRMSDEERFTPKLSPDQFEREEREHKAQQAINQLTRQTGAKLIVTARQIYAFRAHVAVPPLLAVTSRKRYRAKQLSHENIIREIYKYKPKLVILTNRWPGSMRRKVRRRLVDYHRVLRDPKNGSLEIYLRK